MNDIKTDVLDAIAQHIRSIEYDDPYACWVNRPKPALKVIKAGNQLIISAQHAMSIRVSENGFCIVYFNNLGGTFQAGISLEHPDLLDKISEYVRKHCLK